MPSFRELVDRWVRHAPAPPEPTPLQYNMAIVDEVTDWDSTGMVDTLRRAMESMQRANDATERLREAQERLNRVGQFTYRTMPTYSDDAWAHINNTYRDYYGTDYPRFNVSTRADTRTPSTHVEALASWEEELLNTSVGNAHTENDEGGTMPTTGEGVATIEVAPTYYSQREIFERLNITEGLMSSLDVENWTRHLDALRNGFTPGTFNVEVGSYAITGYPEAMVNGQPLRLGSVSLDTARQIVQSASNNRIDLAPLREDSQEHYVLKTLSALEDTAFVAMYGPVSTRTETDPAGGISIPVSGLRDMMRYYQEFRNSHRRDAIRNALQTRMRESILGPQVVKPATEWTTERAQKFGEFFSNIKSNLVVTENPFNDIDILPHGTLSSRFWGIEIEAVDIAGVRTPRYWELKGDGSLRDLSYESRISNSGPRPGSGESAPRSDHDEDCASRTPEDGCTCGECYLDCSCGYEDELYAQSSQGSRTSVGEWNSPPLRSFHSRGLEYICDQIEYRNTNHTPGIHVHIASDDLTPDQVVNVGLIYTAMEPLFEAEYKRGSTRNYCKSLDTAGLVERFNLAKRAKQQGGSLATMAGTSDRYSTVNTQALRGHGTIEFRAMGARYNYEFLVRWAHFLREIVNIAKADVPQKAWKNVKTFRDLIEVFAKYGKETPTPSWATDSYSDEAVVTKLGTESRRVPNQENIRSVPTVFEDYTQQELIFN